MHLGLILSTDSIFVVNLCLKASTLTVLIGDNTLAAKKRVSALHKEVLPHSVILYPIPCVPLNVSNPKIQI